MDIRERIREKTSFVVASHVSWGAIIAGTITVLVIQLTLAMLGLGIGLYAFDPAEPPGTGFGIGALIWWVLSAIIALFLGGWVASRLSGIQAKTDGMLHGFVTWGLASLVTVFLLTTTIGTLIGGGMSLVQGAASAAGRTAEVSPELRQQVEEQLRQYFPDQKPQISPEERERLQERGQEAAEQVTRSVGAGAFGTFIMLVLGAGAGALGGIAGRNKGPVVT
jgi:hypothetical protein